MTAESKLEAIADKHPDLLYGRCATFAIALHRLTGLPIYGLVGYDEEVGKEVLIHAYVKDGDTRIDVKGPRDLDEITADFDNDPAIADAGEVPLTESRVAKLATGSVKCPTLTEVTPIAAAVWKLVCEVRW
jgi:hypothetical protein